jgi:GNAT superfamily N-acetyltransferase
VTTARPGVVRAGPADTGALSHLIVAHAMTTGLVHTTSGREAVAVWLPAGPGASGPEPGYGQQLAAATAPWTGRFAVFDQALDDHHPAGPPHQHLAILAVAPGGQGQGTGTALLDARHRELDRDGVPAYLEASSPRARDLYQRHGYTPRPDAPFCLPGGPPLWPMWREPRARSH